MHFDPINLHKCVITPFNAIVTYYSTLHKDDEVNVESQQPFGRFCCRQSALAIMYTNKYIVKYFRYLTSIDESMVTALETKQFCPSSLNPPGENQSNIVGFFKNCAPKLALRRKSILASNKEEVTTIKHIYKDALVDILRKQNITFYLDTSQPLLMFL